MHVEDYITTVGKQHKNERQNYEFRSISTLREFIEGAIKNCTIPDVSNRRELLLAFAHWWYDNSRQFKPTTWEDDVDDFLSKQ